MIKQQILVMLIFLTSTISTAQQSSATQELNNIIDALIAAGDFTTWVSILSSPNSTIIPISATLFVPRDPTLDTPPPDPFLLPYHIVPQRLTFSDLLLLPRLSRLPTLLPSKYISVTDNTPRNFSLDSTPITHPDLFSSSALSVHGLRNFLDYSLFPPPPFLPIGDSIGDSVPGNDWNSPASSYSHVTAHLLFFLLFCFLLPPFLY